MLARLALAAALSLSLALSASAQEALRVFPNPVAADGEVTVEVGSAVGATADVISVLGRRVDLGAPLAAGVYAVRVRDGEGQFQTAPLTLARPARIRVRLREASGAATEDDLARGETKAGPRLMLVHVLGDSHAAGKGDPGVSCDLRPDVGPKGWVFRRSFDDFVPACSPEADALYNGSVFPSLADEIYDRLGITPLFVFYTVKGSRVAPEGHDSDVHWFPGDDDEPQSPLYTQAYFTFKRARQRAIEQFGVAPDTLATVVSAGAVDARFFAENGSPDPVVDFRPRLSVLNDSLTASGVPAFYFELLQAPLRPEYNEVRPHFQESMRVVLPADRIARYSDTVWDAHHDAGEINDPALWYADRAGHLGSLGLDVLGIRLADLIEFDRRVQRRRTACLPGTPCASGVSR